MAGLNEAVKAALHGPERKDILIRGHGFNVKPIDRQDVNGEIHIWGQISHKLAHRPDDQMYYHLLKKNGNLISIDRQINKGGWEGLATPVAVVVGAYFGIPIQPGDVRSAFDRIAQINPNGWQQACDVIIGAIALHV